MTDEEKEAIDKLKTLIQYLSVWKENFTIVPEDVKYLIPILNLIEKQSKEIEENECVYKDTSSCTKALSFKTYKKLNDIDKKWEDKIKAKIEEVDYKMIAHQDVREAVKQVLQSLLEKE